MAYKELVRSYQEVEDVNGLSATREFVTDANGTVTTLPVYGEVLSGNPRCVVQRIVRKYFGDHPDIFLYTFEYSTRANSAPAPENVDPGAATEGTNEGEWRTSMKLGGELLTVDGANATTALVWDDEPTATVDQKVSIRTFGGGFQMSRKGVTRLPMYQLLVYSGRVNSVAFKGFPAGLVLFEGADANEYFDKDGERRWDVTLNFFTKIVPLNDAGTQIGGWQYQYRDSEGAFKLVRRGASGRLYLTADLNKLIAQKGGIF